MTKFLDYINEKINLPKKKWVSVDLKDLDKEMRHRLWDMYTETYQSIGLHIESETKMMNKYKVSWLIDVDKDPQPDAFIIYKELKHGNKIALMGSDGGKESKSTLVKHMLKLMKTKGWFMEASHGVAKILLSNNINVIDDLELIKKITEKDDIVMTDEPGIYKRKLGSMGILKKRLFGNK